MMNDLYDIYDEIILSTFWITKCVCCVKLVGLNGQLWNYIVSYTISRSHFKAYDERWTNPSSFWIVLGILKDVVNEEKNSYQCKWVGICFLETTSSSTV
jgi:hypothetical protein